jgi:MerR family transcriptional regulator, light-induced transcriptional regulator
MEAKYIEDFKQLLFVQNKEKCVQLCMDLIAQNTVSIQELYEELLIPAINNFGCCIDEDCHWQEYLSCNILRTIIECCYPYVIQESHKKEIPKVRKVILLSPEGDFSEILSRIFTDFFAISGFQAIFVGSNVTLKQILYVVKKEEPAFMAIVVSKCISVFKASRVIEQIPENIRSKMKIVIGGDTFNVNEDFLKQTGADILVKGYSDILALQK